MIQSKKNAFGLNPLLFKRNHLLGLMNNIAP